MPTYSLYFLGRSRRVEGWQSLDCASDTSALIEATALMNRRPAVKGVEVAEDGRNVGTVMAKADDSAGGRRVRHIRASSGVSRFASVGARTSDRTTPPDTPLSYRVVVIARPAGRKGFVWEIHPHDDDHRQRLVSRSEGSYRTMEEAYSAGTIALKQMQARGR
jgi:hypothetical protein